jgi:hypothetical protein
MKTEREYKDHVDLLAQCVIDAVGEDAIRDDRPEYLESLEEHVDGSAWSHCAGYTHAVLMHCSDDEALFETDNLDGVESVRDAIARAARAALLVDVSKRVDERLGLNA